MHKSKETNMPTRFSLAFLYCLGSLRTSTTLAFLMPYPNQANNFPSTHGIIRDPAATKTTTTTALHGFNPFSSFVSPRLQERMKQFRARKRTLNAEQRKKVRERIEGLEEEDFLLMDAEPRSWVHERDFFRQVSRISAWDEYVVVGILCSSISFGALNNFELNPDHVGVYFYEVILRAMVQLVASFAVLSGLYSTMVFALSALYAKTALGLERDVQYDNFLAKTQVIRDSGFQAFSASLALFAVLVILRLAEVLPSVMNVPVGGLMGGALYIGYRDWSELVFHAVDIFVDDDDDF